MRLRDLPPLSDLAALPILSAGDPAAREFQGVDRCLEIAEAVDTRQLFRLLHRNTEYVPAAIVREEGANAAGDGEVRVYFIRREAAGNIQPIGENGESGLTRTTPNPGSWSDLHPHTRKG